MKGMIITFIITLFYSSVSIGLFVVFYNTYQEDKTKFNKYFFIIWTTLFILLISIVGISLIVDEDIVIDNKETIKTYKKVSNKYQEITQKYKKLSKIGMINSYVDNLCKELDLDSKFIKNIIFTKSKYNTNLIGKNGEIGLMQIKLSTAQIFNPKLTKEDLLDWRKNIYYGCLYLKAHKEYNKNNNT